MPEAMPAPRKIPHPRIRGWGISILLAAGLQPTLPAAPAAQPAHVDASLSIAERFQLEKEARVVVDLLQNYHYSGTSFREIANSDMISRFLEELDPGNQFFTKDDIRFVHGRFDHSLKSVYVFRGDLEPAFEIFDLFSTRVRARLGWIEERLGRPVDLAVDAVANDYSEKDPALDPPQLEARWEASIKAQVLAEMVEGRAMADAEGVVGKRYADYERQFAEMDALSVREHFFDSLIRSYDPHSGYFSADSAKDFAVMMGDSIVGAGIDVKKEGDTCLVTGVQPGSSADLTSKIQPGDTLDALAQGDGPWVSVGKLRLREILALARGQPGTRLRIAYFPAGSAARTEVVVERAKVLRAADRAHGAISRVPDGAGGFRRIGWITLPSFYAAEENPSGVNAAADVRELLSKMATPGIDGLVLDIRDNPGGALKDAVDLCGLFLPHGVAAYFRGLDGSVTNLDVAEHKVDYPGPLVVLTSPRSASASEFFAGTMGFYRRALIVGGRSTFGKGTVQNYLDMSKLPVAPPGGGFWGTLKLTFQRFYMPDGRSVQRTGALSDVVIPVPFAMDEKREEDLPHSLPVESIVPPARPIEGGAPAAALGDALRAQLIGSAAGDVSSLPEWALWQQEQKAKADFYSHHERSLRLDVRQREWDAIRAEVESIRRSKRALASREAFQTDPLEIAVVQAAFDAHEGRLRAARAGDDLPFQDHLERGIFVVTTEHGHLRGLRLEHVDFREFSADAQALAAAFAAGSGRAASPSEMGLVLRDLALLEHKTNGAVLECFPRRIASCASDPGAAALGAEACFRRMAEIDGDMLRDRPGLDVPLRECLRLASDWAQSPAWAKPAAPAP